MSITFICSLSPLDCILHCSKAPLGKLSLSRVVGNKTPGLCCKTFPLQEAVPEEEVEEIQRIVEQKAIGRVRFLNHCLYELERESGQVSGLENPHLTAILTITKSIKIHLWVCDHKVLFGQRKVRTELCITLSIHLCT